MQLKRVVKFEAERDPAFAQWISHTVGGERIRHCLQCGLCSGSCPLSLYMDYTPRRLMHLSREGFKEEVLSSYTIWLCTCCYACMVECPKKINITHLMYALKTRAIQEHFYPKRFAIPELAREFSRMVRDSGRITESRLVMRVFFKTAIWRMIGFSKLGWRLMRTGRMRLAREKVSHRADIVTLLDAVGDMRKELAR
ncbi:MAG: 4Fe-4S dicluster domain-containing protein [Candidatus Korobacteraceae bacterium]